MANVNINLLMQASGLQAEHPTAEGKASIKATAVLLKTSKNGVAVIELTAKKNCGTIGYLLINVTDFRENKDTAGLVFWKDKRDKATLEKMVNAHGATLGLESVKPKPAK